MRTLSDGETPNTLGGWLKVAQILHLEGGEALLRQKIEESPKGEDDEVIADEGQMLMLLLSAG
jgi:hypothetical protein